MCPSPAPTKAKAKSKPPAPGPPSPPAEEEANEEAATKKKNSAGDVAAKAPPTPQIRSHFKNTIEIAGGPIVGGNFYIFLNYLEVCTCMKLLKKLSETELIDFLLSLIKSNQCNANDPDSKFRIPGN